MSSYTRTLPLFILPIAIAFSLFLGVMPAYADTFTDSTGYTHTVSMNKTSYAPNETMVVTGDREFYINGDGAVISYGTYYVVAENIPTGVVQEIGAGNYNYSAGKENYSVNFTAPSTPGTYTMRFYGYADNSGTGGLTYTGNPGGQGTYDMTYTVAGVSANIAPNAPAITGPTSGRADTFYNFSFQAQDPDGDQIKYYIDWDNNGSIDEGNPYDVAVNSGTALNFTHKWTTLGSKTFRALTEDSNGARSGWTSYTITLANAAVSCSQQPQEHVNQTTNGLNFPADSWCYNEGYTQDVSGKYSNYFEWENATNGTEGPTNLNECAELKNGEPYTLLRAYRIPESTCPLPPSEEMCSPNGSLYTWNGRNWDDYFMGGNTDNNWLALIGWNVSQPPSSSWLPATVSNPRQLGHGIEFFGVRDFDTGEISGTLRCNGGSSGSTANLQINNSDGPLDVALNTPLNISWSTTGVTSCTAWGSGWGAGGAVATAGTATTTTTTTDTYILQCTNGTTTVTDSVQVNLTNSLKLCQNSCSSGIVRGNTASTGSLTLARGSSQNLVACFNAVPGCSDATGDITATANWGDQAGNNSVGLPDNPRRVTGDNVGSERVTAYYQGNVAAVNVTVTCLPTVSCDNAPGKESYCDGDSFTIDNGCGTMITCNGAKTCNYNWKEVAP